MTKTSFIKENFSLVVGVALPVLLVIAFWLSLTIPKLLVAAPQYDLIFASDAYDYNNQVKGTVRFEVRNGKLRAVFHENEKKTYRQVPRLYYFDVATESTREIPFDIPADVEDRQAIPVEEAERYTLSPEILSPDGYRFESAYHGSGGLAGEMFVGGRYRYHAKIRKNGRSIKIPHAKTYYYHGNIQFIGWVTDKGGA